MTELGKKLIAAVGGGHRDRSRGGAPLDPKDYEIACLKLRNEQMHRRIAVLEQQLKEATRDPWAAGEGEV